MLKQILIALDQLLNVFVYLKVDGMGYADETLSARAWRIKDKSNLYTWINRLFFWQENHCKKAYEEELANRQLPREYRKVTG